jgi:H+/Cl- antiporter ClcA
VGGCVLALSYQMINSERFLGLGTPFIHEALIKMASFRDPILKTLFSSLTIASGFKGGEFVPIVFIGTTLGSALGTILPISFTLLAALGFAAVFAGAANTPLACAIMAAEIFGWKIFFFALLTCYMSYFCSGHPGIYKTQKVHKKKNHLFHQLKQIVFKK